MRNVDKNRNCIRENGGSTLITVIVAIAFVTILTSIILGVTLVNFRMKSVDRVTRDDFYYAEKAYNDIFTGIGQDMSYVAGDKYDEAFKKVGTSGYQDSNSAKNAEKEFRSTFIKEAYDKFALANESDRIDLLKKYITFTLTGKTVEVEHVGTVKLERKGKLSTEEVWVNVDPSSTSAFEDADRVVITGVEIYVEDTNSSYQSTISSDIVIEPPSLEFFGTNVDISDYGLIANEGIYITGDGEVDITGDVYGGLHAAKISGLDDEADILYGGINIDSATVNIDGKNIVSKGDINLSGNSPKLTISSATGDYPNVWYDSLRTTENSKYAVVDATANLYALNDLEINGKESDMTISGNYYGYNDMTLYQVTTDSSTGVTSVDVSAGRSNLFDSLSHSDSSGNVRVGRDDADSSAIIINGPKAKLDMKDISSFVLMGRAYVDFNKLDTDTGTKVLATAEGVGIKTNQQLYLLPTDFIDDANPSTTAPNESTLITKLQASTDFTGWFGYRYLDATNPIKVISAKQDSVDVYYIYLNFDESKLWQWDNSSSSYNLYTGGYLGQGGNEATGTKGSVSSMTAFFDEIMNATEAGTQPNAKRLKERMETSIAYLPNPAPVAGSEEEYSYFNLQDCLIGGGANPTIVYAQNAVVNYAKDPYTGTVTGSLVDNKVGMERYAAYPQNLFHRYLLLCSYLESCGNVTLEQDPYASYMMPPDDSNLYSSLNPESYHTVTTDAPVSKLVITSMLPSSASPAAVPTDPANNFVKWGLTNGLTGYDYGECIVCQGPYSLSPNVAETFKGIAIIDGDVTIPNNVNVDGIVIATGKITIIPPSSGTKTITYDKGLIQARIEKEIANVKSSTAPKNSSGIASNSNLPDFYLIKYLSTRTGGSSLYDISNLVGTKKKEDFIAADYNSFMHYENWHKGPVD